MEECRVCDWASDHFALVEGTGARYAYAMTEKRSEKATRDLAREAVLSVASASIASLKESEEFDGAHPMHYAVEVLPLIVTRSPLVACQLDSNGEVELSLINRSWVRQSHESFDDPVGVFVVTAGEFPSFIRDFMKTIEKMGMQKIGSS